MPALQRQRLPTAMAVAAGMMTWQQKAQLHRRQRAAAGLGVSSEWGLGSGPSRRGYRAQTCSWCPQWVGAAPAFGYALLAVSHEQTSAVLLSRDLVTDLIQHRLTEPRHQVCFCDQQGIWAT